MRAYGSWKLARALGAQVIIAPGLAAAQVVVQPPEVVQPPQVVVQPPEVVVQPPQVVVQPPQVVVQPPTAPNGMAQAFDGQLPGGAAPPGYYYPAPYAAPIDTGDLERRGRAKKIAGAVLLGVGAGLSAIGIGLAVDGALHVARQCASPGGAFYPCRSSGAEVEAQVERAHRLSGRLAFQPLLGPAGSGGAAHLHMTF
jgi:hypothetical protein